MTKRSLRPIASTHQNDSKSEAKVQFQRKIKLINGIALVVGTVIGSGIFVSPQGVYKYANCSIVGALIVWSLCGIFSMLGSLCYSEIGTTITRSGGDYAYILEGFGPFIAYLNLWVSITVIRPTTQTIMALTFAYYILGPFYHMGCHPPDLIVRALAALALSKSKSKSITSYQSTVIFDYFY
jgi:amino acid transporter